MKKGRSLTFLLMIIYLVLLTWIILFKMSLSWADLPNIRSINFIPFGESVIVNGQVYFSEIIDNLIAFIPLGIYLGMLNPRSGFFDKLWPIVALSLFYEVVQYALAIGATDITDLIANTAGGIVGILLYLLLAKVLKEKTTKVLNTVAAVCTVLAVAFLAMLIIAN